MYMYIFIDNNLIDYQIISPTEYKTETNINGEIFFLEEKVFVFF